MTPCEFPYSPMADAAAARAADDDTGDAAAIPGLAAAAAHAAAAAAQATAAAAAQAQAAATTNNAAAGASPPGAAQRAFGDGNSVDAGHGNGAPASGEATATLGGASRDTRRTVEEMIESLRTDNSMKTPRDSDAFVALPAGPWATREGAQADIQTYLKEQGYEGVFWTATRKPTAHRGAQASLACKYNCKPRASIGTGVRQRGPSVPVDPHNRCPYVVTLEETTSGWAIMHANLTHTCPKAAPKPMSDAEKALTYNRCRKIPDQLLDAVTPDILLLNPSVQKLNHFLRKKAEALGVPVTWEYQDVHNQFADSADEIAYDATGLVDFLEQRQQDTGLAYSFKLNKRGELSCLWWELVRLHGLDAPGTPAGASRCTEACKTQSAHGQYK
jgi:hypothetical protein